MKTSKPFPFTAEQMRAQLPMKAKIFNEGFDVGGVAFEGHIRLPRSERGTVVVAMPEEAILIPVDEWKEMIAWVARYERAAGVPAAEDREG